MNGWRKPSKPPGMRSSSPTRISDRCMATCGGKVKTDGRDMAALARSESSRMVSGRLSRLGGPTRDAGNCFGAPISSCKCGSGPISHLRAFLRQGRLSGAGSGARRVGRALWRAMPVPPAPWRRWCRRCWTLDGTDAPRSRRSIRSWGGARPADPGRTRRLQTVPGVGPIVAADVSGGRSTTRRGFPRGGQASAAIGLVPREDSSAERRHRGHITKAGPSEARSLLVQAAWACWRGHAAADVTRLGRATGRAAGGRIAVVALARRLSRILFAIWRDDDDV